MSDKQTVAAFRDPKTAVRSLRFGMAQLMREHLDAQRSPELRKKLADQFECSDVQRMRIAALEEDNANLSTRLQSTRESLIRLTEATGGMPVAAVLTATLELVLPSEQIAGCNFTVMLSKKGLLLEDLIITLVAQYRALTKAQAIQEPDVVSADLIDIIDCYLTRLDSPSMSTTTRLFITSYIADTIS
jgi:hypothetical protein